MKEILTVSSILSANEVVAVDAFGRGKKLPTTVSLSVGDGVLVVNNVAISKVPAPSHVVYEV